MNKFLFVLFSLIVLNSSSQQSKIDSLKIELKKESSKEKKNEILESLNKLLISHGNLENESIPYFVQMASLSKELGKVNLETRAYRYLSECYMRKEDFINAELLAVKSLNINDSLNNIENYLIDINQLGRVYHHFQKHQKAIEIYKKGIAAYQTKPIGKIISTIYSNLGLTYSSIGEKEKAIDYYLKGAELAEKTEDYQLKSQAFYNIAWMYMNLEQYEKAERYFFNALKDSLKFELQTYTNRNHHGLGVNYSRWGKYEMALKHNNIALKYYRKTGNKLYEFDVLNNIAVVYVKMDQPRKVIDYADKALKIAENINHRLAINGAKQTLSFAYIDLGQYNYAEKYLLEIAKDTVDINLISRETKMSIYKNLSSVYKGKKDFKKSLMYFTKFKNVNDSILIDKRDSNITEIETKYQTEKKEKENLQLIADIIKQDLLIEKKNRQKQLFASLFGATIIVVLIIVIYTRNKRHELLYNAQLDIARAKQIEHQKIGEDLHDQKAKILEGIVIELKKNKNITLANKVNEIKESIRKLSRELSQVSFEESEFDEQIITLLATYDTKNISLHQKGLFNIKWNTINNTIKRNLFIVIREGISNSYNHSNAKRVNLDFQRKGKQLYITITDDGKGFDKNKVIFGLGFTNMKMRINEINGNIKIESEKGKGTNIGIYLALA